MNTKRGDMPAMPVMLRDGEVWSEEEDSANGLTIREQFAMAAMQGLITAKPDMGYSEAAHQAKAHADALLFELERTK